MALTDTYMAISAVTDTLKDRISTFSNTPDVTVGRPDESKGAIAGDAHINLFLYEIHLDEHLKNTPLNECEKPPLWLVLKYLVTAFNGNEKSNDIVAHKYLGAAMRAVSREGLLKINGLTGDNLKALSPNPEELHVTFDDAPSDLLTKLMQGTDEKLRLSFCFQVRPVMIAAAEPGDYSLLVGIDYTKPPTKLAEPYVGLDVIPAMRARIDEISPVGFEVGEEVTIRGSDLHLSNLSVMLGAAELPVTMQQPDELKFKVDNSIIETSGLSAGSYPITVAQTLAGTGKRRRSNALIGNLVPTIRLVEINGRVAPTINVGPPRTAFATINLTGQLLGLDTDDTILAFYRDGQVIKMFDLFAPVSPPPPAGPPPPPPQPQPTRQLIMASQDAVPVGDYNMILIVNGQQAPQSPVLRLDSP